MADFVFPPGGEGVEVVAPNGVKYFWDVNNNRWGIRGTTSSLSEIVKISTVEPDGVEGDLWYKTGGIHKDLFIKYAGAWEQAAPGKLEYDELVDRIALLENTTEIINEYKCELATSVGGITPQVGGFKTSSSGPKYATSIRVNPKDLYGNPIPIIHEGDGFEMLHEENGHSHRYQINSVIQSSDTDLTLKVKFLGGDEDSFKQNDHYLFRFHTPNTDMEVLAHLDRDQTFIGKNQFDGDVVFTGNVTLPDDDGDGSGEEAPSLDGDNTFSGDNTFTGGFTVTGNINTGNAIKLNGGSSTTQGIVAKKNNTGSLFYDTANDAGKRLSWGTNKIWMYVDTVDTKGSLRVIGNGSDDNHQFVVRDKDGSENFVIDALGDTTVRGGAFTFKPKGIDDFDSLFSSRIKVNHPDGWDSTTHGEFGFYIDISQKNTWKNRFVIGGRAGRQKAFEVYDDGEGVAKVWGSLKTNNKITAGGDVEIRASLGSDDDLTDTEVGKVYLITAIDLSQPTAAVSWARAGAQNLNPGSIFRCMSAETLPAGNTVQEFLGSNHLNVVGDISAGGEISGDDIEGHTFLFSGDGALQGNTNIQDATLEGKMTVASGGSIDMSSATISNSSPIPKSWFTKVLKEFAGEFKTIYINEGTNGTSDPAINIRAAENGSSILIKDSNNATKFSVNVGQGYAFGGSSSAPWMAAYDHHFTTKKYVDDAVAGASGGGPSFGYKFTYTNTKNNMGTGKFTSQNESGTFKLYLSETTADGVTWYDNGDMALKALDFESAGGPGPMYTIRDANDSSKIMRQGFLKAIQYQGNQFVGIFDGATQINVGSMTIGGNYNITIGGLF